MSHDVLLVGIAFPTRPELHEYINENEEEFCKQHNILNREDVSDTSPIGKLSISYCTNTGTPHVVYTIHNVSSYDGMHSDLLLNDSIFRKAWQAVKESSEYNLHECLNRAHAKLFVFCWHNATDMPGYESRERRCHIG